MSAFLNCRIEEGQTTDQLRLRSALLMPRPSFPALKQLSQEGLVYVPFLGRDVLERGHEIWGLFGEEFERGIYCLEDYFDGYPYDYNKRFESGSKLFFSDPLSFTNGGFFGRFVLWIGGANAFIYLDNFETSFFGAPLEAVRRVVGGDVLAHLEEFEDSVRSALDDIDAPFLMEVALHAARQQLNER